jgi:hypothetical protein
MRGTTSTRGLKKIFDDNIRAVRDQIQWVMDAPNNKILTNRIGVLPHWTQNFILHYVMPMGLRKALNKKYPKQMEIV